MQTVGLEGDASTVGSCSPNLSPRPTTEKLWGAADMVVVVMGLQDNTQLELLDL